MGAFDYYNLIEKCLLEVGLSKGLAMCLSRFKPADWNKFLDVVLK